MLARDRGEGQSVPVRMDRQPPLDPSFRAFLHEVRATPGFGLRTVAAVAITLSLSLRTGLLCAVAVLGVGAIIGIAISFPIFRRTGRTW